MLLVPVGVHAQQAGDVDATNVYLWAGGSSRCAFSTGNGAPSGGATCDTYIDYATGDLWTKLSGTWEKLPRLSAANLWTQGQEVQHTEPTLGLYESDAAADQKRWRWEANGAVFRLQTVNDASSSTADLLTVTRTGGTWTFTGATLVAATGSFSTAVALATNNTFLTGKDSGGNTRNLIGLDNTDIIAIANGGQFASFGGSVGIPNAAFYEAKDAGGTLRNLVGLNGSNIVSLDPSGLGILTGGIVTTGGTFYSGGSIGMPNATYLQGKDSGGSYRNLIGFDASNIVQIASSGHTAQFGANVGINTPPTANNLALIGGTLTGNASNANGLYVNPTLSPTAGSVSRGLVVSPTINEAGSGTHALLTGASILAPVIVAGAAAVTDAATLYVSAAPTVTVTGGAYALWVAAGATRLGGTVTTDSTIFSGGSIGLPNAASVQGKDTGGSYRALIGMTAGDVVSIDAGAFGVTMGGTLGVTGTGTFTANVNPAINYTSNLGALSMKYLTLHAAELWVETLVAQNTMATIGGRVLVAPTNILSVDLAPGDTTITVKYNNFSNGDRVYLEANAKIEWMAVTSAAGGGAGAYTYSVTRDLDGTGANQWYAGDAVLDTGTTGNGFIDLYSAKGVMSASHNGPTIVGNVRTGTAYNAVAPRWAIGNLDGLYGYSGSVYGAAFGDGSNTWLSIDATNGVRGMSGANVRFQIAADGSGQLANSNITWDTSGNLTVAGNATIAGWTVNSAYLAKDTGTDATSAGMAPLDYPFYAGATYANRASAPFRVTPAGAATMTSGAIGGWTLGASSLTGGNATLASSGNLTLGTGNDVVRLSADDATYRLWIGNATAASAPFRVTKAGAATLSSVASISVTANGLITAATDSGGGITGSAVLGYQSAVGSHDGPAVSLVKSTDEWRVVNNYGTPGAGVSELGFWNTTYGLAVVFREVGTAITLRPGTTTAVNIGDPVSGGFINSVNTATLLTTSTIRTGYAGDSTTYTQSNANLLAGDNTEALGVAGSATLANINLYVNGVAARKATIQAAVVGTNGGSLAMFTKTDGDADVSVKCTFYTGLVCGSPTGGDKGVGTINAAAVYDDGVLLTDWVFEAAYHQTKQSGLMASTPLYPLTMTRTITEVEHRLPWMPTTDEFQKERKVGGMITRLWQGQEQQQLYLFELLDRIAALEAKVAALQGGVR